MTLLDEKKELLTEIKLLGYESLRFSIFGDHRPAEWETRIEYDDKKRVYEVYSTMDRASFNKKLEFLDFKDAKKKFIEKLDLIVQINKSMVKNGKIPEYSSPLWDKAND